MALHVAQAAEQALLEAARYLLAWAPYLPQVARLPYELICSVKDTGSHYGGARRWSSYTRRAGSQSSSVPGRQIVGRIHDINGPRFTAGHHPLLPRIFNCSIFDCLRDLQARRRVNASVARNGSEVDHEPCRWA